MLREATWSQTTPDRVASHVHAFEYFQGVPELVILLELQALGLGDAAFYSLVFLGYPFETETGDREGTDVPEVLVPDSDLLQAPDHQGGERRDLFKIQTIKKMA